MFTRLVEKSLDPSVTVAVDGETVVSIDGSVDGSERARKPWREKNRRERGIVIVWFALLLVALLGFAGFAVDLSNWWLQADRLQRAADAGAHAGVVYLPADLPSAKTAAIYEMSQNGYKVSGTGANGSAVITQEPNPSRLRVSLKTTVPTYFVRLLGVDHVTLTRDAVAEFVSPVPMGSPQNKLGNDPDIADPGTQMWVNISAPNTDKAQGDRYQSIVCAGGEVDCTSKVNNNYEKDGYFFSMKVGSVVAGQPLDFEVYDAAWVPLGSNFNCNRNMLTSTQINNLKAKPQFADAATRYGGTQPTKYCTGDGHAGTAAEAMDTTFIFRQPDSTPWDNTDNPVINTATCKPVTVPGYLPRTVGSQSAANYVYNLLNDPVDGAINPDDGTVTFAETFMRWTRLCRIPAGSVTTGEYIVQVRTNARSTAPLSYDSTVATKGHNKMSFRVGFGSAGAQALNGGNVTIAALGKLPVFANSSGADTRFYLARVMPYDAGRTLRVNLFDMGEGSSPGELQILPPAEFATQFSGCGITRDDGATLSVDTSTCTLKNVSSSSYNGRQVTIDVPIPSNYTCQSTAPTGCWIKIKAKYPSGSTVTDATTWSAAILGNPIRLVE